VTPQQSFGGRRAPLPPSPLKDEIVRARLVETLAARFDVPLTVLVAAAGFGKTTALAQAIRANDAAPRGIDAWVACEPGDEDGRRLAAAILSALGATRGGGSHVDRVLGALRALAPVDVCVVMDDLHELPSMSAGEQLVCELSTRLPAHAHLVLSSRRPVPIPLARRRAAGQVVEVDDATLAFSDAEVGALAERHGENRSAYDDLAGWPSLVRLVLSAPPGATRQFLWEEIVAVLSPAEQSGLLALAVLGSGSASEVALVAGGEVDIDRLLGIVPLLYEDAHGTLGAHQLWEDAAERIFPAAEVRSARRRALQLLFERGETVRVGSAAARWGDPDMFRAASVSLVRESLGVLPTDTAIRWLARTPRGAIGTPEHRLLDVAVRHAQLQHGDDLDDELDALEGAFLELGDTDAQAVVLGLGAVSAHARGDIARLMTLTEHITSLPGVTAEPLLRFFVDAVDAALASLAGDVERTLETIEGMSFDQVPTLVREIVTRLHATTLVLAGRAPEAVPIAGALRDSPHEYVRSIPSMVRWLAGDPEDYLADRPSMEPLRDESQLYRFVFAAHIACVAASLGDLDLAADVRPNFEATNGARLDARDSAIAAIAVAACKILEHDEGGAASVLAEHLSRHALADARSETRLRRNLAIAYVVSEDARQLWDAADLGPMHRRARGLARLLVDARRDGMERHTELGAPATVVASLPLAWSVELAVRASACGCPDGSALLRTLAAWLPAPTRREVEWLAERGDATCRNHAGELLDDLHDLTREPLTIEVLGPLRLREGSTDVVAPEIRRGRVRTLLELLVVLGPTRRERICDLLWPDLEPDQAAGNLRVTLSRLRRLVEPALSSGRSTSRLLSHGDTIELAGPPLVDTDLWQLQREVADADRAREIGDSTAEIACLVRAFDHWRGEALVDLGSIGELSGEVEYIRRILVDGCLRLGELLLVAGRVDESLRCAEKCRGASPYSERAHRLTIACHLQRRDHDALQAAVRSTEALLTELGVEPEDATKMLLRRAAGARHEPGPIVGADGAATMSDR
jgi:ATP/maltotriose-dependent transcriptional regulator MalT/DNA-binding SARP family transcriptional activator